MDDSRQEIILHCPPVVARGSRPAIVGASLMRSDLWRHVHVLRLNKNMPLRADPEASPYAEYILRVGDGVEPPVAGDNQVLVNGDAAHSAGV
ncbi:hypothetical protein PsorP6_005348 [Peronosclerospora sorghi]|uniref:Uncharacterized protein n=1 Tax=Peronosclerospora sorghi TaxID=230839 RepID=A0ACC0W4R6_9STRA|nr:hypothetical protein PsorP6_005348 [Peronosclerospora sorghi]